MSKGWMLVLPAVALSAFFATEARAAETRITRDQLPEAVRKTADEQSQGATVRGYTKEVENHQLVYEIEMTASGHSKDVSIAPDGRVLEVEEEVSLKSLSPQVRKGLEAKAAGATIGKVESLYKNGKIVAYEAQLLKEGKHSEIQVGPDGALLIHQE